MADLIEEADHALRLAGNEGDLRELDLVRAELALNEGDPERTLAWSTSAVDDSLPPNTGEMPRPCATEHSTPSGREEEAAEALTRAALLFEEAGAYRRALDAWRAQAGVPPADGLSQPLSEKSRVGRQPATSSCT